MSFPCARTHRCAHRAITSLALLKDSGFQVSSCFPREPPKTHTSAPEFQLCTLRTHLPNHPSACDVAAADWRPRGNLIRGQGFSRVIAPDSDWGGPGVKKGRQQSCCLLLPHARNHFSPSSSSLALGEGGGERERGSKREGEDKAECFFPLVFFPLPPWLPSLFLTFGTSPHRPLWCSECECY
jgi:hypothetical protein